MLNLGYISKHNQFVQIHHLATTLRSNKSTLFAPKATLTPAFSQTGMSSLDYSEALSTHDRNVHRCKACPYFTTSFFLMLNHLKLHKSLTTPFNCESSQIESYTCNDCNSQTELTVLLKLHVARYHNVKTEDRNSPNLNFTIHKYVCERCNFETNFALKWFQHILTCSADKQTVQNESVTEVVFCHYCDKCDFRSKYKHCLRRHKYLKHLNDDEIAWFHCLKCPYKCKRICNLRAHVDRKHEGKKCAKTQSSVLKNIKWYDCEKCPYKAKHKSTLKSHINARHLDEEDVKWHECDRCPFKSKHKSSLITHVNHNHLDKEDIKWYECKKCPYKAKLKTTLKYHVSAQHLDEQDIEWYKCEKCPFKTKKKSYLKRHVNVRHLDEKNAKWYECVSCP